jgi:hypothetical protein
LGAQLNKKLQAIANRLELEILLNHLRGYFSSVFSLTGGVTLWTSSAPPPV